MSSTAIEAYRYDPNQGVLQIVFVDGRHAYDYPCSSATFRRFVAASSKGRFVNGVLGPSSAAKRRSTPPW